MSKPAPSWKSKGNKEENNLKYVTLLPNAVTAVATELYQKLQICDTDKVTQGDMDRFIESIGLMEIVLSAHDDAKRAQYNAMPPDEKAGHVAPTDNAAGKYCLAAMRSTFETWARLQRLDMERQMREERRLAGQKQKRDGGGKEENS